MAQVIFDDTPVTADRRIGAEGQGMPIALHALDNGRLGIAAAATGLGQAALNVAARYAAERDQFGKPIASFQGLAFLLADMGAEVIKIEPPEGDPVRQMGQHYQGESLYAASILRNKRSIVLDLKTPEGRQVAADLIAQADILVENNRPGVLERLNLG